VAGGPLVQAREAGAAIQREKRASRSSGCQRLDGTRLALGLTPSVNPLPTTGETCDLRGAVEPRQQSLGVTLSGFGLADVGLVSALAAFAVPGSAGRNRRRVDELLAAAEEGPHVGVGAD
jgi:hypothetical protein